MLVSHLILFSQMAIEIMLHEKKMANWCTKKRIKSRRMITFELGVNEVNDFNR